MANCAHREGVAIRLSSNVEIIREKEQICFNMFCSIAELHQLKFPIQHVAVWPSVFSVLFFVVLSVLQVLKSSSVFTLAT